MLANSDLIPGIYNFCDSWCERCLLTRRCRSFQMQHEAAVDQPLNPNASLVDQLTEALNLTKRYIDKLQQAGPTPLVGGPSEQETQTLEEQVLGRRHRTKEHPVATLATAYLKQTGTWLSDERGLLEQAGKQQLREMNLGLRTEDQAMIQLTALKNAYEQIRWYRTLIPVKTIATLRALDEPNNDEQLRDYYDGKAKLVLVSIDRSLASWQTILYYYPDKLDGLLDMLALLVQLSRQLDALFPNARTFRRPGLD